jgi:hypothetical protein
MHGTMLGKKKLFVSFAERKVDRQMRLKAIFESMEKLALELRSEVAIKSEQPRTGVTPIGLSDIVKSVLGGYRRGAARRGRRFRRGQPGRRIPSEPYMDPSFVDIDFHEDFPPLPKSIKPNQSPTLQKLTEALAAAKLDAVDTPEDPPATDLVVLPRAPPPSSAEISTAGNTAPSTPTPKYTRPRITPQSLHDKLLFANATLATLQESPLLRAVVGPPAMVGEEMLSLDTTAGTIPVEAAIKEEWVAPLVPAS